MRRLLWSLFLLVAASSLTSVAGSTPASEEQPLISDNPALPLYYVIDRGAIVFRGPDESKPYLELSLREPVYLIEEAGDWSRIRTREGAEGYLPSEAISNVWIRVSKKTKEVAIYRGTDILASFPADFGFNTFSNKERRGGAGDPDHWRTPEGSFYIVRKNPRSQYHKAFVLNYPTSDDAERGYKEGLISRGQRDAIVNAEKRSEMPPMNTRLGGMIEIHGHGTGNGDNWTQGCVAVRNLHIDLMWSLVHVGTPVYIE